VGTRPNGKITRKQDKKEKMELRTISCEIKKVIILNLLDNVNDSPFLTVN